MSLLTAPPATRSLGQSGIEISPIAWGMWRLAEGGRTVDEAARLVHAALDAGITSVADWLDGAHPDAALQAHLDSGIRSVVIAPAANAAALQDRVGQGDLRHTIAVAIDDAGSSDTWDEARRLGLRIHAHATANPGSLALLASRGVLGPGVTLIHLSRASEEDLDVVASTGTAVVLTPAADMAAGLPVPPIQGLIDRGIRPGLGVDREHLAPGDAPPTRPTR